MTTYADAKVALEEALVDTRSTRIKPSELRVLIVGACDALSDEAAAGLDDKAPIDSPEFTGVPLAPTVVGSSDSSTKIATTAFVQAVKTALRDEIYGGTPSVLLDTITELSEELADDTSAIAALTALIADKQPLHALLTAVSALTIAKGSLIAGSGAGALTALSVGTDGQQLQADAASPGGIKWASPASGVTTASALTNDSSVQGSSAADALNNLLARGRIYFTASRSTQTGALLADGSAYSRTTYAGLYSALVKTATVTISIASPGVVTWAGHGLLANEAFKVTTTGAVPTGLTAGTTYYVKTVLDANTFTLAATEGGTVINTSGSQSGTHTGISAPFGDGDGSTTFNVPNLCDGSVVRGLDLSGANDANRSFGKPQADQMQGHIHGNGLPGGGGPSGLSAASQTVFVDPGNTTGPTSDGTNGTPRTGKETRMRNVALLPYIIY